MKHHNSKPRPMYAIVFMLLIVALLLGCGDDDDEASITVCNLDSDEYDVELRRDADDSVVGIIHLEEWYDPLEHCDSFEDVHEDRYYLVVINGSRVEVDQSDDFYLSEGEHEKYNIDTDGDLIDSFFSPPVATVSVCNLNNDFHHVALKRSSDDSLVAEYRLGYQQEALDHCIDFENLDEGSYYLEIDENNADTSSNRSDDFYLAPNESESFTINRDGKLMDR